MHADLEKLIAARRVDVGVELAVVSGEESTALLKPLEPLGAQSKCSTDRENVGTGRIVLESAR